MKTSINWKDKEQVARALLALYSLQTLHEQLSQITLENNERGFNGVDASFCSSVAEWILGGKPFTHKQFERMARILPKYHRQLSPSLLESTPLPETALQNNGKRRETREKREGPGRLDISGPDRKLTFEPYIYPSTQIKRTGVWQYHKPYWVASSCDLGLIQAVIRLFPGVEISPVVQSFIDQLTTLEANPQKIEEHDTLFPFQKEAIQFLRNRSRAMVALAPGLGKTAVTIFAADSLPDIQHVLVVVPLSLVRNWQKEISKWVDEPSDIWRGKPEGWTVWGKDWKWVITNYDTVRLQHETLLKLPWDLIIFDESVLVKNRKAKRTAKAKVLAKAASYTWMLTGAPMTRFYDDLWSQVNILDSRRFSSYWRFAAQYCIIETNEWGSSVVANKPNAHDHIQEDLADIYFCRTQDQVLDLPPWIFEDVFIPLGERQYQLYAEMEEEFMAQLSDDESLLAPNQLAQLTRLIQLASNPSLVGGPSLSAKWDVVPELLEYHPGPHIIWTNYIDTAKKMKDTLIRKGYRVESLTGSTPTGERQEIVDAFQNGEVDVLLAHPGVGKFGFTLTAARTAIYLERSYDGDNYYQSLHRVRRIGTEQSPIIIHLIAEGPGGETTVDSVISKVLAYRKESNIKVTSAKLKEIWHEAT